MKHTPDVICREFFFIWICQLKPNLPNMKSICRNEISEKYFSSVSYFEAFISTHTARHLNHHLLKIANKKFVSVLVHWYFAKQQINIIPFYGIEFAFL